MVVNAPETPTQAEVIFAIETTSSNGAYISELKTNYILPTLEYFHGGPIEEGGGNGTVYAIVTYNSADSHPGLPVATQGPFTCPQNVVEAVDKLQFIGGHAESRACVTEALATCLACFDELGRTDVPRHIILLGCSAPYSAFAGGLVPPGVPATIEQAARMINDRGIQLSVACAKRVPALLSLYESAGGELLQAQQRNYAKDPRHLVLLRGYSLKERPPSPAPPPAPDIQADLYGQGRGTVAARPTTPQFPRAAPPPPRGNWLPTPRQSLYANNSALLTQLAQPSYPPPPAPQQSTMPRLPNMLTPQPGTSAAPPGQVAPPQRTYIWSGVLEWMEKGKPGDQKVTRLLPCQVSLNSKDIEAELKVDTWPNKLVMQLMPKQLISNIGGQYLKDSKSVLFHLQQNEALEALTKIMVNGFAGCVHFSPMSSPPQCEIKVLILLYTPDKKAYLGFIPNNQATFVDRLKKVIQQQKISQFINKQQMPGAPGANPNPMGALPNSTMAGPMSSTGMPTPGMSTASMSTPGLTTGGMPPAGMNPGMNPAGVMNPGGMGPQMAGPGPSQGMSPQMQHPQPGMMMGGGMGGQVQQQGGKGPRAVQLDGLEAARQQNLEKIQHLQQTLEAAHQQEAQFKTQMDLMSHLQQAQQQEQQYKQMEEQRKQHQLQQQLQQQLRGAGGHQRMLRPMMPANPGLRHLLQQQQQAAARGARPAHNPHM